MKHEELIQDLKVQRDEALKREKCVSTGVRSEAYYRGKAEAYTYAIGLIKMQLEKEVMCGWCHRTTIDKTFNNEECYHNGKYTYNKETFECHKCGLIVPNEYRFNTKEK